MALKATRMLLPYAAQVLVTIGDLCHGQLDLKMETASCTYGLGRKSMTSEILKSSGFLFLIIVATIAHPLSIPPLGARGVLTLHVS